MNVKAKLLYIGRNTNNLLKVGGNIGRKIHEDALEEIFGDRIDKYLLDYKKNSLKTYFYKICFLYFPEISPAIFTNIKNKIEKVQPQIVFIESSQYGSIVKYIKKKFPAICIITFFHNIELQYAMSFLSLFNIKSWLFYRMSQVNEAQTIKYSDKYIVLNYRDANLLQQLYKRNADCILPVSFKDVLDINKIDKIKEESYFINKHECLFVGMNFEANIQGLNWFIKKVLPFVDVHLRIIGAGMSKVFSNTDKITVMDYVDDLSEYYLDTDFIIEPIFDGGGMKTKTAEAMMWGKAIIGTDEAFCGYEIDNISGLYRCNTDQEMIEKIQSIYNDNIVNFNVPIRELFLEKYSFKNTLQILNGFFYSI
jgi:glycosyltransferase involved in cell wall biosynthesis